LWHEQKVRSNRTNISKQAGPFHETRNASIIPVVPLTSPEAFL